MKEAKGKHVSNDHANLSTDLLNLTCHILAGITSAVVFPSTSPAASHGTTPQPSMPSFRDLTEDEIAALNSKFPAHSDYIKKYAKALSKTHQILLDNRLITPEKLVELEKNYINLFTHQLNQTQNIQCNQNDYYAKALEAALLSHASIKTAKKTTRTTKGTSDKNEIDNSLAYAWKDLDNKNEDSLTGWLNAMSDAHGLIQVTGWSTQNENSLFAIFDYYNYKRYEKDIAEARFILISLIAPFYPLFTEYQDIARREKNTFMKVLRTAIPMLITAAFIIGVTALIPIALPELAFFILAIPLLYLGLALASLYVKTKELTYRGYRHVMYAGDINLFPEFEASDDLKKVFGEDDACKIREYYIQAIQACNTIEASYNEKGLLDDDTEEAQRTANIERSHALLLEWFDLRDNRKLNKKNKLFIALKRLESDEVNASKTFKLDIKSLAHAMGEDVNTTFYTEEGSEQEEAETTEANTYTASSLRFFPSCPQQRDEISKLQALEKAIEAKFN